MTLGSKRDPNPLASCGKIEAAARLPEQSLIDNSTQGAWEVNQDKDVELINSAGCCSGKEQALVLRR